MSITLRRWALALPAVLTGLALVAGPAHAAAPTTTNITTPSDPFYTEYDQDNSADPINQFTVSGNSNGDSGSVDIVCTYTVAGRFESATLATSVLVQSDGTFSGTADNSAFVSYPSSACRLHALPSGTSPSGDLSGFAGPVVYPGWFRTWKITTGPNTGTLYDYYVGRAQAAGFDDYDSLGSCGLDDADLTSGTDTGSELFYCNDYLSTFSSTRGELVVDGATAYTPDSAEGTVIAPPPGQTGSASYGRNLSGFPVLTYSHSWDPGTGDLTITESDPLVICSPDAATYPPNTTSCTSWTSAGVRDDRTIVQDHSGNVVSIKDDYVSTDGRQHSLDLLEENDFHQPTGYHTAFRFPWAGNTYGVQNAFTTVAGSPYKVSTVFAKFDVNTPDGSIQQPHGAITFDEPVQAFIFGDSDYVYAHITRTVPAGGTAELNAVYSMASTESGIDALAAEAESRFPQAGGPPPPPVSTQPKPTVAPSRGRLHPRGLTLHLRPRRHRHVPAHFTVSGRVLLPAHASARSDCRGGVVTVQVKAGKNTISTRRAGLRRDCTYRLSVTFRARRRLGRGHLRFTPRFSGNAALLAVRGRSATGRVG